MVSDGQWLLLHKEREREGGREREIRGMDQMVYVSCYMREREREPRREGERKREREKERERKREKEGEREIPGMVSDGLCLLLHER